NRPTPSRIKPFCKPSNYSLNTHEQFSDESLSTHSEIEEKLERSDSLNREAKRRAKALPSDFSVSDEIRSWAEEKKLPSPDSQIDEFRDYCIEKGRVSKDWDRAFRNWLRKAARFSNGKQDSGYKDTSIKASGGKYVGYGKQ